MRGFRGAKSKSKPGKATKSRSEVSSVQSTDSEAKNDQANFRNPPSSTTDSSVNSDPPDSANTENQVRLECSSNERIHDSDVSTNETVERLDFQVHVRIRPIDDQEFGGGSSSRLRSTSVKGGKVVVLSTRPSAKKENNGSKHSFRFDSALDESSTQKDVYDVTAHPLVEMVLKGHKTCYITYGSPGTGKSYTLFGKASSGKHKGIITRAAESILASMEKIPDDVKLTMSFIQLYNEKFYDILDSSATDNIRFHDTGDTSKLDGITELPVNHIDDVNKQLRRNPNRLRDAGRSHTIFTLYFRKEEEEEGEEGSRSTKIRATVGKMDFVDLVGVSRSTKHSTHDSTGNNATAKANKSLQVFSKVIHSLTEPDNQQPTPYRDSKLTRLLKEPLGGNCVTRLLVAASPCPNSAHETLVCLHFATSAMSVHNQSLPQVDERVIKEESPVPEQTEPPPAIEDTNGSDKKTTLQEQTSQTATTSQPAVYTGSLPPINARSSLVCGSNVNMEYPLSTVENPQNPENSRNRKDSVSKGRRSSQEDGVEGKSSEKKSKKRHKTTSSNASAAVRLNFTGDGKEKSPLYWQQISTSGAELMSGGQVVALPHITGYSPQGDDSRVGRRLAAKGSESPGVVDRRQGLEYAYSRTPTPPKETMLSNKYSVSAGVLSTKPPSGSKDIDHKEAFAASLMPAAFDVINNRGEPCGDEASSTKRAHGRGLGSVSVEKPCCATCVEREEQIKANYDHLIMFSKRDRDVKQQKIEELEIMLKEAKHGDSAIEIENLQRERNEFLEQIETLQDNLHKSEEMIEKYKQKTATMVTLAEFHNLQEQRQREVVLMEQQRDQIQTLSVDLEEQTKGASRMLEKKSEQNQSLEEEITQLRNEMKKKERDAKTTFEQWQSDLTKSNLERDRLAAQYENAARETSIRLESALAEIESLKEGQAKKEKESKTRQDVLQRELSAVMLKFAASKQEVEKLSNQKPPASSHSNRRKSLAQVVTDAATNTEDLMKEKLNGLAYSVQCLRCAAKYAIANGELKDCPDVRDAEMRILLFQDTKNREILVQLKRERDLLRDVMKIMYCRQWFTEEGKPHVKRTLRRVGIDSRELDVIRKKTAT